MIYMEQHTNKKEVNRGYIQKYTCELVNYLVNDKAVDANCLVTCSAKRLRQIYKFELLF